MYNVAARLSPQMYRRSENPRVLSDDEPLLSDVGGPQLTFSVPEASSALVLEVPPRLMWHNPADPASHDMT